MSKIQTFRTELNTLSSLTERETEYLSLAAMGFKNKQIGYILSVSKSTVKKTFENVFQKLYAKDRANAVALGFIHGFLNVEILNDINSKFKYQIKNIS